jgi:hypothetical protein
MPEEAGKEILTGCTSRTNFQVSTDIRAYLQRFPELENPPIKRKSELCQSGKVGLQRHSITPAK